jgi:hypothetical protein
LSSSIALILGRLELGNAPGKYSIVVDDLNDVQFASGITALAYIIVYNILSSYNPITRRGSRIPGLIGTASINRVNASELQLQFTEEFLDLENRIKASQVNEGDIPTDQLLGRIELLGVSVDIAGATVNIEIRIENSAGDVVFVRVT